MAIPVTILSGFLGAGKTTLLNNLLREDHGLRIGVLVNDFGDINLDAELIEAVQDDIVQLSNGCICCSIREDLLGVLWDLMEREDCPDYLIIEASGIADPSSIAFTFSTPGIRETTRLDAVVTVIDCEQAFSEYPEDVKQLQLDQLQSAQIVVLNKIDLVDRGELEKVERWVKTESPAACMLHAIHGRLPATLLLDVKSMPPPDATPKGIKPAFESWSIQTDEPVSSLRNFSHSLKQIPAGIIRVKGILYLSDMPETQIIVHRVGKRTEVFPGKPWGATKPTTKLVAIGLANASLSNPFEEMDW